MEFAFIPNRLLKYLFANERSYYNWNVLFSNILVLLVFSLMRYHIVGIFNLVPHFCLFNTLFKIDCPVCGVTRSICVFFEGDVYQSLNFNPIGLLILLFILFQIVIRSIMIYNNGYDLLLNNISKKASSYLIILLLIHWIYIVLI
jgi:hypothetical protein